MPEARIILSETTIYLAASPKSNSAYAAINLALQTVQKTGNLAVPLHLRNAPTTLMKELGYGENYQYAHNYKDHFVRENYFPEDLAKPQFYLPGENLREEEMRKQLNNLWTDMKNYDKK